MNDYERGPMLRDTIADGQPAASWTPPRESLLALALDVLARRVFVWAMALLAFGLFAFCVWRPAPWSILAASLFTLFVYVPLSLRKEEPR